MSPFELVPGVDALDHTADVGIEVHARTLPSLFDRAARGAFALVAGDDRDDASRDGTEGGAGAQRDAGETMAAAEVRTLELESDDVAGLLAGWLRELLFLHEVHDLAYHDAEFDVLERARLRARVRLGPLDRPVIREIKAVTYHGLVAEPRDGGWFARVIFDV